MEGMDVDSNEDVAMDDDSEQEVKTKVKALAKVK